MPAVVSQADSRATQHHKRIMYPMDSSTSQIVVKLLGRDYTKAYLRQWLRQFPDENPAWGDCRFTFDPADRHYDWLVAYDELPPQGEQLACPPENTLLVTGEPSTIKVYGRYYLSQFGHVLTSQEPWVIDHPGTIRSQPALLWYYGLPLDDAEAPARSFNEMASKMPTKSQDFSTVCSNKQMKNTLHNLRYNFTQEVKAAIPEMDVFGHGVRPMSDKAEALDPYRYHLAIENRIYPHHWTEKLSDTFLAGALPFYAGCPNATDYFASESFIPLDLTKPDESIDTIKQAIATDQYTQRLDAIQEARQLVLNKYNLFAVLAKEIKRLDTGQRGDSGARLVARKALRKEKPWQGLKYLIAERMAVALRHRLEK